MIIGFLYWGYKKDLGKRVATYAVSALIVSISLNNIVMRRRPYYDHSEIKCLKPRSDEGDIYDTVVQGFSFPKASAASIAAQSKALTIPSRLINARESAPISLQISSSSCVLEISSFLLGVSIPFT